MAVQDSMDLSLIFQTHFLLEIISPLKFNPPYNATQISQAVRQAYVQVSRENPNFRCWNPAATYGDEWLRARISRQK